MLITFRYKSNLEVVHLYVNYFKIDVYLGIATFLSISIHNAKCIIKVEAIFYQNNFFNEFFN